MNDSSQCGLELWRFKTVANLYCSWSCIQHTLFLYNSSLFRNIFILLLWVRKTMIHNHINEGIMCSSYSLIGRVLNLFDSFLSFCSRYNPIKIYSWNINLPLNSTIKCVQKIIWLLNHSTASPFRTIRLQLSRLYLNINKEPMQNWKSTLSHWSVTFKVLNYLNEGNNLLSPRKVILIFNGRKAGWDSWSLFCVI